jgi:exodeoxyribonuclease-1
VKKLISFLWHDYETFGANPMVDRPAQFAAQRTDSELRPIGDPVVCYCAPANDVLPHPAACLITGITPQEALRNGVVETQFAATILAEMMRPGTCSAGYNSIRFDDVITRNLLYRNLRDPYEREYRNGNSRWDLIDLTRMCDALRPGDIEWPMHEPGRPSFRLEDLSSANKIMHEGAHDALADVQATIGWARLLKEKQPRLFEWALSLREQQRAWPLLDPVDPKPVLHSSSRIPAVRGCTTLVLPLAVLPDRPKSVIVFDLMADPAALIHEAADVISDLVFTAASDLPEGVERLPLKTIHSNHVPMLAPAATLRGADPDRIGLDPDRCLRHADQLRRNLTGIRHKVIEVFNRPYQDDSRDPDLMIYSGGFFSASDRHLMKKVFDVPPADLSSHVWSFQDPRLPLMLFRYRARNHPETLSAEELAAWDTDRYERLINPVDSRLFGCEEFRLSMAEARQEQAGNSTAQRILDQLDAWVLDTGLERLRDLQ